jgi:hypothetical protein
MRPAESTADQPLRTPRLRSACSAACALPRPAWLNRLPAASHVQGAEDPISNATSTRASTPRRPTASPRSSAWRSRPRAGRTRRSTSRRPSRIATALAAGHLACEHSADRRVRQRRALAVGAATPGAAPSTLACSTSPTAAWRISRREQRHGTRSSCADRTAPAGLRVPESRFRCHRHGLSRTRRHRAPAPHAPRCACLSVTRSGR